MMTKYEVDKVLDILAVSEAGRKELRYKEIYIDSGDGKESRVLRWTAPEATKALWEANSPLLCLPKAALKA